MRELAECAPGLRVALEDGGYRILLEAVMDEISLGLKVLFDRRDAMAPLWPRPRALDDMSETLNNPKLTDLWSEDEAIGWIYQYFNADDVKQMRAESSMPRNSRELAVRNQFFTPRYVVEFLTDNTLGRIWYEMTQGKTRLLEQCHYLVRRPNEIFLGPGEAAPEQPPQDDLSQEELLRQPVHIQHRPLKDPRDIRMIDPACGSMHFGLYAFDLFEVVYDEAWEIAQGSAEGQKLSATFAQFVSFVRQYPNKAAFLADVPRFIIEHNLHGVDIDPRAVQIAGLSLWLRAQRAWQTQGLNPEDRPRIHRSNIVCAEPMPGEEPFLEEFVEKHLSATPGSKLLGQLVRHVFDAMRLAREAGSLLKIEEEIASAVAKAKEKWLATPKAEQGRLFADETAPPKPGELGLEVTGISDEVFWERTEERIYAALKSYAEQAEQSGGYQRRLFTEDAAQGFAFIDLCRKRQDVVLMNPPFGDASLALRPYIGDKYRDSKSDIGMAFVARFTDKLQDGGRLGAITNRVFVANETLGRWRDTYLLGGKSSLNCFLDLGFGVLDDAKVETAAFVIDRGRREISLATFVRVLDATDKESVALSLITSSVPQRGRLVFVIPLASLHALPGHVLAYQLPRRFARRITKGASLGDLGGRAAVGLQPSDDFRFVRLAWEVSADSISRSTSWCYYAKGGEYQPYWDDVHLLVKWANDGAEIRSFAFPNGKPRSYARNAQYYFRAGVTYPERTTSDLSPRVLPADCIFSGTGQGIFCGTESRDLAYITGAYSRAFKLIVDAAYGSGDASAPGSMATHYRSAVLARVPPPLWARANELADISLRLVRSGMEMFDRDETSRYFTGANVCGRSLRHGVKLEIQNTSARISQMLSDHAAIDEAVFEELGFDKSDREVVESLIGPHALQYRDTVGVEDKTSIAALWHLSESDLIRYATSKQGSRRQLTMKSYAANRRLELVAHALKINAGSIAKVADEEALAEPGATEKIASRSISWMLGVAFGRWDIRFATGKRRAPELPNPFAPLPVCPPGQLQNGLGLPTSKDDVSKLREQGQWDYPIEIAWDGILVDDLSHQLDIESRVHQMLEVILEDRSDAIEREACEILGVRTLRDYFRKPTGFFANHLRQYSKSRRNAPIYWPLSTKTASYTVWIYYHRLTADTLFQVVAEHLDPKLRGVQGERLQIEAGQGRAKDREAAKLAKQAGELAEIEQELEEMKAELLRVAELPYKPDLNDGVQITAAPLWKLFQLPAWRKVLEATWKKLEQGEYDWAHLSYAIWPERVREKCKTDRSLAIAHGLEDLCEVETRYKKRRSKRRSA